MKMFGAGEWPQVPVTAEGSESPQSLLLLLNGAESREAVETLGAVKCPAFPLLSWSN